MEKFTVCSASDLNNFIEEARKYGAYESNGSITLNGRKVEVNKRYEKILRQYIKSAPIVPGVKKPTLKDGEKLYKVCYDEKSAEELIELLDMYDYVTYDTETTGLNVRKDRVIGYGIGLDVGLAYYFPKLTWKPSGLTTTGVSDKTHLKILNKLKQKKLIMHNASFDCRVTNSYFGVNLTNSVYADTVLLMHTLNEDSDFGLKDLAVKFSKELKLDSQDAANQEQLELKTNVIANGGKWLKSNKDMYMGDTTILAKYCCADVDITLRLFHFLENQLSPDLMDFFYNREVMPLYKYVTIPMEERGVHLDLNLLDVMNTEVAEDINRLEKEIQAELTEHSSNFIKNYLNENYPLSNKGTFAQGVVEFFGIVLPKLNSGKFSITSKSIKTICDDKIIRFFQGELEVLTADEVFKIQKYIHNKETANASVININSKHHLSKIIFGELGEKPQSTTEKGSPQVNEALLLSLKLKYSWISKLIDYNKLIKIKNTYIDRFLDRHENGIYYAQFKQHATTSGRYGSDLQQLTRPKDEDSGLSPLVLNHTNKIRALFIAPAGYKYVDDDYESLEPRVFADDAGDQALIDIFLKNLDMYSVVAIMALELKDVTADKKSENFLKKKYPEIRQQAKPYALGIRYGMKEFKLAKTLDISEEEASKIISNYFKAFPNLKKKMDQYLASVKTTGQVVSKYGRIRHLPRARQIYENFGDAILDYKNLYPMSKKHRVPMSELKILRKEYNNLLNNALNFPIQSAATSIINQAMIAMSKEFNLRKLDAWVSLAVHDQVIVTSSESCVQEVCRIVQNCMENTNTLSVPLIAVPQIASNMKDGH